MPALSLHWDLGKNTKLLRQDGGSGSEARLDILMNLMARSNLRLRCWPSIETLMADTGFGSEAIAAGVHWLFEHHLIYNVPYDKRVGDERKLSHRKYLYQLTGIMEIDGKIYDYLLLKPNERESIVVELREIGADKVLLLHEMMGGHDGSESEPSKKSYGSESERSESERLDNPPQSSTSIESLSSTSLEGIKPAGAVNSTPSAKPNSNTGHKGDDELDELLSLHGDGLEDNPPAPAAADGDLHQHPRVQKILRAFGKTKLTKEESETLRNRITVVSNGHQLRLPETVLDYAELGYDEFIAASAAQFKHNPNPKLNSFIRFIQDFDAEDKKMQHWTNWRRNNPTLCSPGATLAESTAVVSKRIYLRKE